MTANLLLACALALGALPADEDVDPTRYGAMLMDDTDLPAWERRAARAAFLEARARPAEALPLWQAVRADPRAGSSAEHAAQRIDFLHARRDADGSLDGWTRLQSLRLHMRENGEASTRADVVALLATESLSRTTRAEARLWLARDALYRRKDAQQAHDLARGLWVERAAWPDWVGTRAGITLAKALARLGRWEEARAIERGVTPDDHGAPRPTPVDQVARDLDLGSRRTVAWAGVGTGLLVLAGLASRAPRPIPPLGLVALLGSGLVGAAIAHGWQAGTADALPVFLAGAALVHVLAAHALSAGLGAGWRALGRLTAFTTTLALAWLSLDAWNQLEWMGW